MVRIRAACSHSWRRRKQAPSIRAGLSFLRDMHGETGTRRGPVRGVHGRPTPPATSRRLSVADAHTRPDQAARGHPKPARTAYESRGEYPGGSRGAGRRMTPGVRPAHERHRSRDSARRRPPAAPTAGRVCRQSPPMTPSSSLSMMRPRRDAPGVGGARSRASRGAPHAPNGRADDRISAQRGRPGIRAGQTRRSGASGCASRAGKRRACTCCASRGAPSTWARARVSVTPLGSTWRWAAPAPTGGPRWPATAGGGRRRYRCAQWHPPA